MAVHLIQASLEHTSALAEDRVVNTFYFEGDSTVLVINNAFDMVQDYYTVTPTGQAAAVDSLLSGNLSGLGTLRAYNLEDPQPRVPVTERDFTFIPGTGDSLPHEVSIVMSFQATRISGTAQARRRNRIYIGPLAVTMNVDGRPLQAARDRIAAAARDMKQASDASINMNWVVFSPTIAALTGPGSAFALVSDGWVDNAFDTQRRRGEAATDRLLFSSSTPA